MSLLKAKVAIQPKPVTVTKSLDVKPEAAPVEAKKQISLEIGEIETAAEFPTLHRGSMYDFRLEEMAEKQRRFIKLPEGLTMATLKAALTQHIAIEREERDFRQNFRTLPDNVNGSQGYWVYCMNIEDMPMRQRNKDGSETEAQAKVA